MTALQRLRDIVSPTMVRAMSKPLAQSIGDVCRAARERLNLTQADCAELCSISTEFYARIERGKSLPSVSTFARLVAVLGLEADAALGLEANAALGRPSSQRAPRITATWIHDDPPMIRRLARRLRTASPRVLRLVTTLLNVLQGDKGE